MTKPISFKNGLDVHFILLVKIAKYIIPTSSRKLRFVGNPMHVTFCRIQYRTHNRLKGGGSGGFLMYSMALIYFRYFQYSSDSSEKKAISFQLISTILVILQYMRIINLCYFVLIHFMGIRHFKNREQPEQGLGNRLLIF